MAADIGTVDIYIDGALILSLPGASLKRGGENKSPVLTDQNVVLKTSEFTNSLIKATVPADSIDTIENLADVDDLSAEFTTNNGIVYTIDGVTAHMAGDREVKKGGVDCEFFGQPAKRG